ncbi:MAG: NUDIX domain-containing protein [Bacteroidota bacterium]
MQEKLQDSPKYRLWEKNLRKNGLDIQEIEEIYTRHHSGRALFGLVLLRATTPEGDKIPPICFIKGTVVSILICLIDEETQEKYLLLVKQRRVCTGGYIYEQPAGLVDGEDHPDDVAVRETEEETGLKITKEQINQLNEEPWYPSTGTSEEAMYFYYVELEMSKEKIFSFDQQQQGLISEHERIITEVVPIDKAKKIITNTNGLLNIYLYEEAVRDRA